MSDYYKRIASVICYFIQFYPFPTRFVGQLCLSVYNNPADCVTDKLLLNHSLILRRKYTISSIYRSITYLSLNTQCTLCIPSGIYVCFRNKVKIFLVTNKSTKTFKLYSQTKIVTIKIILQN